jgi:hypothetical protein
MPKVYGLVTRVKAAIQQDSAQVAQRLSSRGDSYIVQLGDSHNALCDEGSYFRAVTPSVSTAGTNPSWTAISGHHTTTASVFTDVNPVFMIQNAQPVGGKSLFMDYVRLNVMSLSASTGSASVAGITTGASTATGVQCAVVIDTTNRYVSGGNLIQCINSNINNQYQSSSIFRVGNVGASVAASNLVKLTVTSAGATARTVGRTVFRSASAGSSTSPIPTAGDTYAMDFGDHISSFNSFTTPTTGIKTFTSAIGPVVIGPGHCLLYYLWYPGYGALTNPVPIEVEAGWWEK